MVGVVGVGGVVGVVGVLVYNRSRSLIIDVCFHSSWSSISTRWTDTTSGQYSFIAPRTLNRNVTVDDAQSSQAPCIRTHSVPSVLSNLPNTTSPPSRRA